MLEFFYFGEIKGSSNRDGRKRGLQIPEKWLK